MALKNGKGTYQLMALTDLWTGSVALKNGQMEEKPGPDRLINTGMLGSIRWWFEVLVRGLGGNACDPTDMRSRCEGRNHCVVCELFGCTGWARKFRFEVLDENSATKTDQIKQNQIFILRFTPLRPICIEEWTLLDTTLRLIADYGAIGGKTVFKPSDEPAIANVSLSEISERDGSLIVGRTHGSPLKQNDQIIRVNREKVGTKQELKNQLQGKEVGFSLSITVKRYSNKKQLELDGWVGKKHHQDYGLVRIVEPQQQYDEIGRNDLKKYLYKWQKLNHDKFAWASLQHFWCVNGKYLARQDGESSSFNQVIGRPEPKSQSSKNDSWIAGRRPDRRNKVEAESKKVFSFKDPARTFGFVKPCKTDADVKKEFEQMEQNLKSAWGKNGWDFLTGNETTRTDGKAIMDQLFAGEEDRP